MLKALIIADNQHRNELIRLLMLNLPTIYIVGRFPSLKQGLKICTKEQPDVIFMDVFLDDSLVFDTIKTHPFSSNTEIVFISNSNNYAYEAYKFRPAYYITKPISQKQVEASIKAVFKRKMNKSARNYQANDTFTRHYNQIMEYADSIVFCKQYTNKTYLVLDNGLTIQRNVPLSFIEAFLPAHLFTRINDKCIINMQHLVKIKDSPNENIVLDTGHSLNLNEERKACLIQNLQQIALMAS